MAEEGALCRFIIAATWTALAAWFGVSVAAENDAEALEITQKMGANAGASWLELWQGERCVRIMREPTPYS
jgi:hypothetical protein